MDRKDRLLDRVISTLLDQIAALKARNASIKQQEGLARLARQFDAINPQVNLAIFDKDGTLITSERWLQESIARAFRELGVRRGYTMSDHKDLVSMSKAHSFDENLLHFAATDGCPSLPPETEHEARLEWVKNTLKPTYRRIQPTLKDSFLKPTPGAVELVQALIDRRIPIALNSSGLKRIFNVNKETAAVEVLRLFEKRTILLDDSFSKEEIAAKGWEGDLRKKPEPDTYQFVSTCMMHVEDLKGVVVFEDTPKGALAAVRAGVGCVVVTANSEVEDTRRRFLEYQDANGNKFEPDTAVLEAEGRILFVDSLSTVVAAIDS